MNSCFHLAAHYLPAATLIAAPFAIRAGRTAVEVLVTVCLSALPAWFRWGLHVASVSIKLENIEDVEALGSPLPYERHVGASYSRSVPVLDERRPWDRGWLRREHGCLCFRGYGPYFTLPVGLIESVEVAWSGRIWWLHTPRVLITWRHPEGTKEHICLQTDFDGSPRSARCEAQLMVNWIVDACRSAEAMDAKVDSELLPFRYTEADKAVYRGVRDALS